MESAAGKERLGPVGRPSRCAAAVSIGCVGTARPRRPRLSARVVSRGGGLPPCADRPLASVSSSTSNSVVVPVGPAALASRRARRRVTTQAHQMLTSYKAVRGSNINNIDTASGGVSSAATTADSTSA